MFESMEPVSVSTEEDGRIRIAQDKGGQQYAEIFIDASQVEIIVQWLKAAKAKLEESSGFQVKTTPTKTD